MGAHSGITVSFGHLERVGGVAMFALTGMTVTSRVRPEEETTTSDLGVTLDCHISALTQYAAHSQHTPADIQ